VSREFLFVLWAGGGNVPPQLCIARRLVARGERVRMLAPAVLRDSIEAAGVALEPYGETPEHDEADPERSIVRDFEARSKVGAVAAVRDNLIAALTRPVALDVLAALERRPADVVAFDFLLFGAGFAAEKARVPAAMLIHTVYPFPVPGMPPYGMGWSPIGGPVGRLRDAAGRLMFRRMYEAPLMPVFNRVRGELGLERVRSIDEMVGTVERALVMTSPAFDFPAHLPANVEYVGPQVDGSVGPRVASPWAPDDPRPLVVVGLSTTYLAHETLLERVVAGLADLPVRALVTTGSATLRSPAPPNVHVERFVPHAQVMPEAAVVVTHAGLGTVHVALAHGVPLVCLPISRDQPDNAARVAWHGAGLRLSSNSAPDSIRRAVDRVLTGPAFAASARRHAAEFAEERTADRAPAVLDALASKLARNAAVGRAAVAAGTA
jgi:MGT family glycosyltransferase